MMVTMAAPAGAEVEVVGVGMAGPLALDEPPPSLHPHAANTKIATARTRDRMPRHYASRMPRAVVEFRCEHPSIAGRIYRSRTGLRFFGFVSLCQFAAQPGFRQLPITLDRVRGHSKDFRCLSDVQSAEEAQLHHLILSRIDGRQPCQRVVERDDVGARFLGHE